MTDARCRVTVVGDQNSVDLAIPAHAPIAEYADALARLCGQPEDEALPPAWSLARTIGAPFPVTATLAGEGVEDGTVLYLRDTLSGEEDEPVVRSVWELVAEQTREAGGRRWSRRMSGRLAVVLSMAWTVAGLAYAGSTGRYSRTAGVAAAILGLVLAGSALALRGNPRARRSGFLTAAGCGVVLSAVLTAVLAPGPVQADGMHLVLAEIGLWAGLIIALLCVPGVLLGALTFVTTCAVATTALVVVLQASATDIAATVVVFGTMILAAAPRVAALLVAVSWLSFSASTLEPEADPARLSDRVRSARRALILIVALTSVLVGVALLVLTRTFAPFPAAVAVVASIVLVARSVTFEMIAEALGPLLAAVAGVFGLVTMLAGNHVTEVYLMPALLLIGVIGAGAGLPVLLWGADRSSPAQQVRPTLLGPILTLGQIVLPALLLGVYGLYATLWALGR